MKSLRKHLLCGFTIIIISVLYLHVVQESDLNDGQQEVATEFQILVANTTAITKLNVENSTVDVRLHHSSKINNFWIGALDCSYELDGIYYSDMANSKLYTLEKKSRKPRVVFSGYENWFPICLAVEDVTGKLYVGDLTQGGLTVHDLATGIGSVVLGSGLLLCVAVAVDVEEKYMFIVDKYQILRLELNGDNAKTIYELGDKANLEFSGRSFRHGPRKSKVYAGIDGMALDRKRKRLYWASSRIKKIESLDYEGGNRKVHFIEVGAFEGARSSSNSLAIAGNSLYWADPIERRILKIKSSTEYEIVHSGSEHATMASCEQRAKALTNPCAADNGGCEHLCLLSRGNDHGYSCSCKFGYELASDGKSCQVVRDFLLFLEGGVIKGLSLGVKSAHVFQPPGFGASENSFVDIDVDAGLLYYTGKSDSNEMKLHERLLDGSDKPKIFTPHSFGKQIVNFAYDWTTNNLYYLSQYHPDAMTLSVTNTRDPTYAKILIKNLYEDAASSMRFFGPVLHPNKGYLFLVAIGGRSLRGEIKRMASDGTDLKVIYRAGALSSIGGITMDYEEDSVYWGEVRESGSNFWQSYIKNSNLNGEDVREFALVADLEMPIGMAIYRNHIYGIDVGKRVFRMDKRGGNIRVLAESGHFAYSFRIHSRDLQVTRGDHPCRNRKCRKFCFAVPAANSIHELKAVCGCPDGQRLANDGVSCAHNSKGEIGERDFNG